MSQTAHLADQLFFAIFGQESALFAHIWPLGAILIGTLLLSRLAQVLLLAAHLVQVSGLGTQKLTHL